MSRNSNKKNIHMDYVVDENVEELSKKSESDEIVVEVNISNLNIRMGPGIQYKTTGIFVKPGIHHLDKKEEGLGSEKGWGRLKNTSFWISLDFCREVD